jgi:hypothetical protein
LQSLASIAAQRANNEEWSDPQRALWQAIAVAAVAEKEDLCDLEKEIG